MVTGRSSQPAPTPKARGSEARRTMLRFLAMMLPVMDATSTYTSPGINFSPLSRGGASDAMVSVKDCSRWNAESMAPFTASSVAAAYRYRNRRALPTSAANRSVGVGLWCFCSGCSTNVVDDEKDASDIVSEAGDGTGVLVAFGERKVS